MVGLLLPWRSDVDGAYYFHQPGTTLTSLIRPSMSSTGTQPPLSQSLTATYGPKLLGLVRRLETDSGGDVSPLIDEALTCLQTLVGLAARQSL